MIIIDKTVISSDVTDEHFICDLNSCKGACCIEGDLGAPLALSELDEVEDAIEGAKHYLAKEAKENLDAQGAYIVDEEGDFSTTTIQGRECSFAFYDESKTLKCSIEQAWLDGISEFRKPISCHLYPIRIQQLDDYEALNYDRWDICECARILGGKEKVPIYKFLKEPLIRKYGIPWYQKLCEEIDKCE